MTKETKRKGLIYEKSSFIVAAIFFELLLMNYFTEIFSDWKINPIVLIVLILIFCILGIFLRRRRKA